MRNWLLLLLLSYLAIFCSVKAYNSYVASTDIAQIKCQAEAITKNTGVDYWSQKNQREQLEKNFKGCQQ